MAVDTPIHVVGAGSMGLLLASYLAPEHPVILVRRRGAAAPAHRTLTRAVAGEPDAAVELTQYPADRLPGPVHRLLLCTKAQDARTAVESLRPRLADDLSALLLQNGLGSQEEVLEALPRATVYAASTTEGAWRPAADEVVHAGRGETVVGPLRGTDDTWSELFRSAGLEARAVTDIGASLADKLRVNALINPLTVIYDCPNGGLLERSEAIREMTALGEETDRVLAAAGRRFRTPALDRAMAVARSTAANTSSMLQDARAGRPLEIEYINGYLVRLGGRLGQSVDANRRIRERVRRACPPSSS